MSRQKVSIFWLCLFSKPTGQSSKKYVPKVGSSKSDWYLENETVYSEMGRPSYDSYEDFTNLSRWERIILWWHETVLLFSQFPCKF